MKKYSRLAIALAFVSAIACNKKSDDAVTPSTSTPGKNTVTLSGNLKTRTLDSDTTYILSGLVYVQSVWF